jgi:hypothetical protein
MKAWIPLTLVFALGFAAHASADCSAPKPPAPPPNGNTATRDEMIAAKQDFDSYNTEMNKYLDCLNLEVDNAKPVDPSKLTPDEKKKADQAEKMAAQKHDKALDVLKGNVEAFNAQLRIYKAKAAKQ